VDKVELGGVLSRWRGRLQPSDVGLPAGTRRRTRGLRREEVAQLAGISVDYLNRLEQARGPHPSDSVLGSLARALRLSEGEREYLFRVAGAAPPLPTMIPSAVRPSTQRLLDRFQDLPALLLDAKSSILAWNQIAAALLGDFSSFPPQHRNVYWMRFVGGEGRVVATPEEADEADVFMVGELRTTMGRYPDDPSLAQLVAELCRESQRFAELWERRMPGDRVRSRTKRIAHPQLGILELDCDVLLVPDLDQELIVYSAAPNTREADALRLLRVIGTQRLVPEPG